MPAPIGWPSPNSPSPVLESYEGGVTLRQVMYRHLQPSEKPLTRSCVPSNCLQDRLCPNEGFERR
jgi:hypothetical protein